MAKLTEMHEMYDKYCASSATSSNSTATRPFARLVTIYIQESSPGVSFLGYNKPISGFHADLKQRVEAANRFIQETGWYAGEVIIDSMDNEIVHFYDSHPERLLIIQDSRVVHDGGKGPIKFVHYDLKDVCKWLDTMDTRPKDSSNSAATNENAEVCNE